MTASMKKLSAGDGFRYFTRHTASGDTSLRGRCTLSDYYSERGERPGQWFGRGVESLDLRVGDTVHEAQLRALFGEGRHPNADMIEAAMLGAHASVEETLAATQIGKAYPIHDDTPRPLVLAIAESMRQYNLEHGFAGDAAIPEHVRSGLRSKVARKAFTDRFQRDPDSRELSGFLARETRPKPKACAGFDITFTPVKSVSVLWAVAPEHVSMEIEKAHLAAVETALAWLEDNALFTRRGAGGVRQVEVRGAVAAGFFHRDSRAGDPNMHTHLVIANRVQDATDGAWLSVDGAALYKSMVCISERYNSALEAELSARLGLSFAEVERADERRPTREVLGVDPVVIRATSRRRAMIDEWRTRLTREFVEAHHRNPTPTEALALAQRATIETRAAKHAPASFREQRVEWRGLVADALGGEQALEQMLQQVQQHRTHRTANTARTVEDLANQVIQTVERSRARFQRNHIRAEAERVVRVLDLPGEMFTATVDQVTARAVQSVVMLSEPRRPVPQHLRRSDGRSMFERADSDLFTTQRILDAEAYVVGLGFRTDGRKLTPGRVELELKAAETNSVKLNSAQRALVESMATSGARVQLALAPAGSGKTTAMAVLAEAWRGSGGTVLGLAPSAAAAKELQAAIGRSHCDTVAKLTWELANNDDMSRLPAWVQNIHEGTLVLLDEAGMTSTIDIAETVRLAVERGASVRLIGDDQQLAAVEAGGVLRDLRSEVGAVTLTELMRFSDPAEAIATLAMRQGDTSAVGFYLDHDRLHEHDQAVVADAVYAGWRTDVDAGHNSIMLAYSNELADALNMRAQADLRDTGVVRGREAQLRRGLRVSAGDVIVTRLNRRDLRLTQSDFVKNGDVWTVLRVHGDGALTARHHDTGRRKRLPAEYVQEGVDLGYARTIHTAQGCTVDTCHVAFSGDETRQLAYTALTRGRHANHAYVFTAGDGDPHLAFSELELQPQTAAEVLAKIIETDGAEISARSTLNEHRDPAKRLSRAAAVYNEAVSFAALNTVGAARMRELTEAGEKLLPGLTAETAWDTLRGHLAVLEVQGEDSAACLREAITRRGVDDARDMAAVLDWRLDPSGRHSNTPGPLPWLPTIPGTLETDEVWGPYLRGLSDDVTREKHELTRRVMAAPGEQLPGWAHPLLGHRELLSHVAVWRAAIAVPDTETEIVPVERAVTVGSRNHAKSLVERVNGVLGPADVRPHEWVSLLPAVVSNDAFGAVIRRRLIGAERAGIDVGALLRAALTEGPLPDEHAAAALWYRIAPTLTPHPTLEGPSRLRPEWTTRFLQLLPEQVAERVLSDPSWPALVAAVDHLDEDPIVALTSATRALGEDGPTGVHGDAFVAALGWRLSPTEPPLDEPFWDQPIIDAPAAPPPPMVEPPAEVFSERDLTPPERMEPGTTRERIVQLHEQAATYYRAHYKGSGAAAYIRGRFGTDLSDDPRFVVGYAPAEWDNLTRHLMAQGATPNELVDAGLARYSRRDTLIDVFRDRVMFGLHDTTGALVGFSGRCAPNADPSVPKYVNTPTTAAFHKGATLFGFDQAAATPDAVPVLTEGVLDAIAVTLSTEDAVGMAPCGTALTQAQAELLVDVAPSRVGFGGLRSERLLVVATDADAAGSKAAVRAFDMLQPLGADTRTLSLAPGEDPASVFATDGGETLRTQLSHLDLMRTLAWKLLDDTISSTDISNAAKYPLLLRECARIIAATPPERWDSDIEAVINKLGRDREDVEVLTQATVRAAVNWHHFDDQAVPIGELEMAQARLAKLSEKLRDQPTSKTSETAQRLAEILRRLNTDRDEPTKPTATPPASPPPAHDRRDGRDLER